MRFWKTECMCVIGLAYMQPHRQWMYSWVAQSSVGGMHTTPNYLLALQRREQFHMPPSRRIYVCWALLSMAVEPCTCMPEHEGPTGPAGA